MSTSTAPRTDAQPTTFPPIVPGTSFLLAWRLLNRPVLLVGGGVVATGRLYYLLEAGAKVTLISPRAGLTEEVRWRIEEEKLVERWEDREWEDKDAEMLRDYDMVLTAIDDVAVSRNICTLCRDLRVPVNVADVPPECDFYFGSQIRRGPLQIMVSTSGRGPRIAALIRQRIESSLPPNVETAILRVGQLRSRLRLMAPGTGGELGQRRMKWMIGVCDNWSLDELSAMSEEMMEEVLKGWEKGEVKGYNEVGAAGGCPWYRMEKVVGPYVEAFGPWAGGFALGAVVSLGLAKKFGSL